MCRICRRRSRRWCASTSPNRSRTRIACSGTVFVLRADLISEQTRALLSAVARVVLVARHGGLADQLDRARKPVGLIASCPEESRRRRGRPRASGRSSADAERELEFFNGLGGFAAQGREYVIRLGPGQSTPVPWINVIANPHFGFQVAADGSGFTWALNSREHQITPWSNDPVADRPGEALYLRDEETGEVWGPTAAPVRDPGATYIARHGQGYSRFELAARDIELDLCMFVAMGDPIKVSRLSIRNTSRRARRLSLTAYVEWVLGTSRAASAPFIVTECDADTGALFARNPWDAVFGSRVAFADLAGKQSQWTADRGEFLGRNGTLANARGHVRAGAPGRARGSRPGSVCARCAPPSIWAPASRPRSFSFSGRPKTRRRRGLCSRVIATPISTPSFEDVREHWERVLGAVQVKTPDRSMDIMLNRWMLYQTLVCRVWARTAFYQASGAYGFRDQLQDGMALAVTQAGSHAGALAPRRRAPIHRRRRAALVAPCRRRRRGRPGRAHPDQR